MPLDPTFTLKKGEIKCTTKKMTNPKQAFCDFRYSWSKSCYFKYLIIKTCFFSNVFSNTNINLFIKQPLFKLKPLQDIIGKSHKPWLNLFKLIILQYASPSLVLLMIYNAYD